MAEEYGIRCPACGCEDLVEIRAKIEPPETTDENIWELSQYCHDCNLMLIDQDDWFDVEDVVNFEYLH